MMKSHLMGCEKVVRGERCTGIVATGHSTKPSNKNERTNIHVVDQTWAESQTMRYQLVACHDVQITSINVTIAVFEIARSESRQLPESVDLNARPSLRGPPVGNRVHR